MVLKREFDHNVAARFVTEAILVLTLISSSLNAHAAVRNLA